MLWSLTFTICEIVHFNLRMSAIRWFFILLKLFYPCSVFTFIYSGKNNVTEKYYFLIGYHIICPFSTINLGHECRKWLGQASLLDSRLSADEWLTGERAQEQLLEENVGNVLSWSTPMAVVITAPSVCRSCCEDFSKVTIVITRTIVLPNG